MSNWLFASRQSENLSEMESAANWFEQIAAQLLTGTRLFVGGEAYRLAEIEFYYNQQAHPDPFVHCHKLQQTCGRWYFHRQRGQYKEGSFKGIDLTFGDGEAFGGILIRSIVAPDGSLIDGPSLCVDRLLAGVGASSVAVLDEAIANRFAWETENPLRLAEAIAPSPSPIYRSARVGLFLKRAKQFPEMPRYVMRNYRFLIEPRRIRKGKLHLAIALHLQGINPSIIGQLTGCPLKTIQRYIADFEIGRQESDFSPYFGTSLNPSQLCRLHGTWHAHYGF